MARNYGNEINWAAQKYGRLEAKLDKQIVEDFKAKLAADNLRYPEWLREQIKNYMEGQA